MGDMLEEVEDFDADDNGPNYRPAPRTGGWSNGASKPPKAVNGFGGSEDEGIRPFSPGGGGDEVQGFDADDDKDANLATPTPAAAPPKKDKAAALLDMMDKKAEEKGHRPRIFTEDRRPGPAAASTSTPGPARSQAPAAEYNSQGAAPPVISDVKVQFFRRRWLQTVLGGPKCLFAGSRPALSLLTGQGLIWVIPLIVGVPLSILHCPAKDNCGDAVFSSPFLAPAIAGGAYLFIFAVLQALRARFRERVGIEGAQKHSVLAEEDEVEGSLFTASGLAFLLPFRGVMGFLPALAAAGCIAVAVHFLSPDATQAAANTASASAASFALSIVGWLVVALAAYSATAHPPPEPNRYHGDEAWGAGPVGSSSRAMHVLACMLPGSIDGALNASPWPRVAMGVLPLLWSFGTVPQVDVLVEWAAEQLLVWVHGGTPAATPARLALMLVMAWAWAGASFAVHVYVGGGVALAVAALGGFVLSHDVIPAGVGGLRDERAALWRRWAGGAAEGAGKVVLCAVLVVAPIVLHSGEVEAVGGGDGGAVRGAVEAAMVAAWALMEGASQLQRPLLWGVLVNPFFAREHRGSGGATKTTKGSGWLRRTYIGATWLGRACVGAYIVCFGLVNAEGGVLSEPDVPGFAASDLSTAGAVAAAWRAVVACRALRRIWQCPGGAAAEAAVAVVVTRVAGLGGDGGEWRLGLGPAEHMVVVGWVLGRMAEAVGKGRFVLVLSVTSWGDAKQRARQAGNILKLLAVGSPFFLAILLLASLLSAPLLPILGVPLFFVGFPRPLRHWPAIPSAESSSLDAAYYRQLAVGLAEKAVRAIEGGMVGSNVCGGEFLLVRRDALIVILQVLERGCGYCVLLVKGMELQETSCHHVEAGAVEEVLDAALGNTSEREQQGAGTSGGPERMPGCVTPHRMYCLEPVGAIETEGYSLGDTQLTGIADSADMRAGVPRVLPAALAWVLRNRAHAPGGVPASWLDFKPVESLTGSLLSPEAHQRYPQAFAQRIGLYAPPPAHPEPRAPPPPAAAPKPLPPPRVPPDSTPAASAVIPVQHAPLETPSDRPELPGTPSGPAAHGPGAAEEETGTGDGGGTGSRTMVFGDDESEEGGEKREEEEEEEEAGPGEERKASVELEELEELIGPSVPVIAAKGVEADGEAGAGGDQWRRNSAEGKGRWEEVQEEELEEEPTRGGGGAWGGGGGGASREMGKGDEGKGASKSGSGEDGWGMQRVGSLRGVEQPTAELEEEDLDDMDIDDLLEGLGGGGAVSGRGFGWQGARGLRAELADRGGGEGAVVGRRFGNNEGEGEGEGERGGGARGVGGLEEEQCRRWVEACWGLVEEWGHVTSKDGLEHSMSVYGGELPSSSHAQWLEGREGLREAIVTAFRYAFKLQYDVQVYGQEEDEEAMAALFAELDRDWYLGPEGGKEWAAAVEGGRQNLMAVWKDKGVSRSRVATLLPCSFQVGRLNGEAVRGLWASLSLELYYFTNDDDERYSIQANTQLLRNLMVQAASPPLGYPLFLSNVTAFST